MKLVRYDGGRTGVLVGERVLDASGVVAPGESWKPLIERWSPARDALSELTGGATEGMPVSAVSGGATEGVPVSAVSLEPPLPDPSCRIFAMGGNFPMHTAATVEKLAIEVSDSVRSGAKDSTPPWGFYVIPGTIVGPGAEVTPPRGTQKLDYEAEVGVVIAARFWGDGPLPIWGYTAWNDFSIRDAAFGLSKVDHGPLTWSTLERPNAASRIEKSFQAV